MALKDSHPSHPSIPSFLILPQNHLPAMPLSTRQSANAIQGEARLLFRAARPNVIISRTYQHPQTITLPNRPLRSTTTSPNLEEEFFE